MGYRAEKDKVEKKFKGFKIVLLCILSLCILGLCIVAFYVPPVTWKYYVQLPDVPKHSAGELRIHCIDVGQGDAILVELPDGQVMLIDGGDGSARATKSLLRYMNALKIDEIDHLIVTHTDGDHCGGLTSVLSYKTVFNAYLPPSFPENGTKYAEFCTALFRTDCVRTYSSRVTAPVTSTNAQYPYAVRFLFPHQRTVEQILSGEIVEEDDNVLSAVLRLEYNGTSALFMGDAPKSVEDGLMTEDAVGVFAMLGFSLRDTDILKLSHHGSDTATSREFLRYLGVQEGIISCGKDNDYGHPAQETLSRLALEKVNVHRTDENGHIMITIAQNGSYQVRYVG